LLPPVIAEFARACPQTNLAVVVCSSDEVCQRVAKGDLHCALVDGSPPPLVDLLPTCVAVTDVVVVAHASHAGTDIGDDSLRSACRLAWAPGSAGEALSARLLGDVDGGGPRIQVDSFEAARRLVRVSPGFIAAMPLPAVREDIASGALTRIGQRSEPLPMFAVRRESPGSRGLEALWRLLIRRSAGSGVAKQAQRPQWAHRVRTARPENR
jgi:hypothetical protein